MMAEQCKDIDAALANLNKKLDGLNRRFDGVDRRLKNLESGNGGNQEGGKVDLAPIYKRLAKLDKEILDLGGVIGSIIDDIKDILDSVNEHNDNATGNQNIFSSILDFFIDE
jgi:hypothetical protein